MLKPREFRTQEFKARLARRASRAGLSLSPELVDSLETYLRLLFLWNQKINLTSLSYQDRPDEALDRLLIEPVVAATFVQIESGLLMDVGSGGGSPAIPLKLALADELHLRMIESKTRKAAFLREAIRQLGLKNAAVDSIRSEELVARSDVHGRADLISIRAVRTEARTLAQLQTLLKSGGRFLLFQAMSKEPLTVPAPLELEAEHALVDALGSKLLILRKPKGRGNRRASSSEEAELFHVEH